MGNATIIGPLGSSDTELPFFSFRVPAGFESPANDHLESRISLDALLDIDAPQTYLVRADGESMTGVGIFDGDLLVVNRALDPASGEVVIAAINGEPVVKTFFRDDNQLVLRSENPKYPPRYVLEGDELTIWGVVISSIRKHRCYG